MQIETNKNGVKLLAAVMAFAMVLVAGFIIVGNGDDVDATTVTGAIEYSISTELADGEKYLIKNDATIDIKGVNTDAITLYILSGKKVTLTSTGEDSFTTTVNVVEKTATTSTGTIGTATFTVAGLNNKSLTIAGDFKDSDANAILTVEGDAGAATITATANVLVGDKGITNTNVDSALTDLGYGAAILTKVASDPKYDVKYTAPGSSITANLAVEDMTIIKDATAIVSQGTNSIKLTSVKSNAGITVTGADTTADYATIGGTIVSGTVDISGGIFKDDSLTGGTLNLVSLTVSPYTYYMNQIPSKLDFSTSPSLEATAVEINGTITQKTSADIDDVDIKFAAGSVYIIQDGVVVETEGNIDDTNAATVKVFGTLNLAIDGSLTNAKVYVGPNGYTTETDIKGNTNVTSGKDYEISGIPSSSDVGDAVINDTLTIPKGTTFTVKGNLGLNCGILDVQGTLVITKGAKIYGTGVDEEKIVLGTSGSIQGEGAVGSMLKVTITDGAGTKKVILQGVTGAQFAYKSKVLSVTGNITAIRNAQISEITVDGAQIYGDLTIAKNVTLIGDEAFILKDGVLTVNGTLDALSTNAVKLGEGAVVIINGYLAEGSAIIAQLGYYDSITNEFKDAETADAVFKATADADDNNDNYPSGFTVYTTRVSEPDGDDLKYCRYAYIEGQISAVKVDENDNENEVLDISGNVVRIAEGKSLNVKEDAKITSDVAIIIEGSMVFDADSNADVADIVYSGAYYTVTPANTSDTVTYFAPLAVALKSIDTADDKTVTAKVTDIDFNVTIGKDQTLDITMTGEIVEDAVVIVENDGEIVGSIPTVEGMLVINPDGKCNAPTSYASKKTGTDGTVTYAGFTVAVGSAQPGDVIDIDSATVGEPGKSKDLNIPAGVKVVIADNLKVYGDLNIPEGAELVGGIIAVEGSENDKSAVNVEGTLDVSAGSLTGEYNEIFSTGKAIFSTKYSAMNGAYISVSGNIVLTSVSEAVRYASENSISQVNIAGKVSDTADITLDKTNLVIDDNASVVLGNITLSGKKITSTGDLTATITGPYGSNDTTGAVADATLKVSKSSMVIESKKVTSAAGIDTYTLSIDAIDGDVSVNAGTVTIKAEAPVVSAKSKLTVAEGAELAITDGTTTLDGDYVTVVVDGKVSVKDAKLIFSDVSTTGKVPVVNGTVEALKAGTVEVYELQLNGTFVVTNTDDEKGTLAIKDSGLTVGTPITSVGAGASIVGPVTLDDEKYIVAYPGADLSAALINVPTGGETTVVSSKFFVNGVEYATVYAEGDVPMYTLSGADYVNAIITSTMLNKLDGVDDISNNKFLWKDAEGNEVAASTVKIGDKDAFYYTMAVSKVTVKVSIGTGMSLWVDGVKQVTGTDLALTVGDHNVQVTINPGYKGTVTISFNGQTVSNGKITVTSAMIGGTNVLSATGDITIDSGDTPVTPVEPEKKDDGMGITDYLLIVLVVLAAILVVIVAIRMMRS